MQARQSDIQRGTEVGIELFRYRLDDGASSVVANMTLTNRTGQNGFWLNRKQVEQMRDDLNEVIADMDKAIGNQGDVRL